VIYTLVLPKGMQVEARATGRGGITFSLPIGENGQLLEVNEFSRLTATQEDRVAELVAHNGL
jgi:hypothetical protein